MLGAVLLFAVTGPSRAKDIDFPGDAVGLAERSDSIIACGPLLRAAVTDWPRLYAGVPQQGLSVAYDAAALRAEAEARSRDFDVVAAPFVALFSSTGSTDRTELDAVDLIKVDFVWRIDRMTAACWAYELRRARLEIDRLRAAYLATPELASFSAKENEIHNRLSGDPDQSDREIDALVAAVRPVELKARETALAAYAALTGHLLERRALLAGSLKSLVRNLHEVNAFLQSNIEPAVRLRAANYLLFADRLFALPAEEVRRIFGPDQNVALLVSALDAFYLLPGPQDVLLLPAVTLSGAQESFRMIEAFAAAPFKQIALHNFRPMSGRGTEVLVIDAGTLRLVAPGAP
jgi:hypothetical protein